ncbi:MAG: SDR family oxidoreductase [archaeon]|nr:SDR family oxidoreductase [archaeon]
MALVTGGGSGIGLRIARELAKLGAHVFVAGRNPEKVERAAGLIREEGGRAWALQMNIRQVDSIQKALDSLFEQSGGALDLLVNNAGGQFPSPAADISPKGWLAVVDTNLNGTFFVTQAVYNRLQASTSPPPSALTSNGLAVVNIVACFRNGMPGMAHSGAARAGVANLTKTLAIEWAASGVRINALAPGVIDSSGLDSYAPHFRERIRQTSASHAYAARMGTEEECAAITLFLLSPAASFITGQCLEMDGGLALYNPQMPPSAHDLSVPFQDIPMRSKL